MQTVGAYEAKTSLSKLLERVHQGESIGITKHGVTVAVMQPPATARKSSPRQAVEAVRQFRSKRAMAGVSVKKMIEEGRR